MSGWIRVCALDEIAPQGSRVVASSQGDIAIFRTADDSVFGLHDKCPHKGGPLSQGIVHGDTVTCPLHGFKIGLKDGEAVAPDKGCTRRFEVKAEDGTVWLQLN
ncbi:MAG: nitrite reductase small subunit NirD [Betaproteobacteria bacterium]|nr:nitrite reductase small subunit NirD [Betaproteobacteria bacterium]